MDWPVASDRILERRSLSRTISLAWISMSAAWPWKLPTLGWCMWTVELAKQ